MEVLVRLAFAAVAGPHVLQYGVTTSYEDLYPRPFDKQTVKDRDVFTGSYYRYAPHSVRHDFDPATKELFPVQLNNRGFRGHDYRINKDPELVRVVTLGASSTFGYHNRDNETYPYYLEQFLNDGCSTIRFEVINLGMPHATTREIREIFLAEALILDPDIVTFYEGYNDSAVTPFRSIVEGSQWLRSSRGLYRWLRSKFLSLAWADNVADHERCFDAPAIEEWMQGRVHEFLTNVASIRDVASSRDIAFVLTSQQAKSGAIPRTEIRGISYAQEVAIVRSKLKHRGSVGRLEAIFLCHEDMMAGLRSWVMETDITFVDIVGHTDARRDLLATWVHLFPEGNRLIAEALGLEILASDCPGKRLSDNLSTMDSAAISVTPRVNHVQQ